MRTSIADAASYVHTLTPIVTRVNELLTHVQKSIVNRRAPAAQQTLALYAVVKGLGRIVDNETMLAAAARGDRAALGILYARHAVARAYADARPSEVEPPPNAERVGQWIAKR